MCKTKSGANKSGRGGGGNNRGRGRGGGGNNRGTNKSGANNRGATKSGANKSGTNNVVAAAAGGGGGGGTSHATHHHELTFEDLSLSTQPTFSDILKLNNHSDDDDDDNDDDDDDDVDDNNDSNDYDYDTVKKNLDDDFLQRSKNKINKIKKQSGFIACSENNRDMFEESALLGEITKYKSKLFLNTHEPFSIFLVGIQGSGKSHSLACVLESCLLAPKDKKLIELNQPLSTLIFHYDTNIASICEVTGLVSTSQSSIQVLKKHNINEIERDKYKLNKENMIVLVSPSYYHQRKLFYGDCCEVRPILFKWKNMTADHIKKIMGIVEGDNQLYVSVLLDLLRKYQRKNCLPTFSAFITEVKDKCGLKTQQGPLSQRLSLLESIIAESDINEEIANISMDLITTVKPGTLIVVDLTDPLLSRDEANCIFQVLTEQYRAIPSSVSGGKVLALDEAHKFMNGTDDGLSAAIVNCARTMRHDDMRLIISTQSPLTLAPELIELSSMAILHRFYSIDWFNYLCRKVPLSPDQKNEIINLDPGNALIFAPRHRLHDYTDDDDKPNFFKVAIRNRLTEDYGASKTNALI